MAMPPRARTERARELRREDTQAEARLWNALRARRRRTAYLEQKGLRVLRFWNSAVLTNREGVCDTILDACGGERG